VELFSLLNVLDEYGLKERHNAYFDMHKTYFMFHFNYLEVNN